MGEEFKLNAVLNLQGFTAGSLEKIKGELNGTTGSIGLNTAVGGQTAAVTSAVKMPNFTKFIDQLGSAVTALKAMQTAVEAVTASLNNMKANAGAAPSAASSSAPGGWVAPPAPPAQYAPKPPKAVQSPAPAAAPSVQPPANAIMPYAGQTGGAIVHQPMTIQYGPPPPNWTWGSGPSAPKPNWTWGGQNLQAQTVGINGANAFPIVKYTPQAIMPYMGGQPFAQTGGGLVHQPTTINYGKPPPNWNWGTGQGGGAGAGGAGGGTAGAGGSFGQSIGQANASLNSMGSNSPFVNISAGMNQASRSANTFADSIALAAKRYGAFLLATTVAFKGYEAIKEGAQAVIAFDASMIAIEQTLNPTKSQLEDLKKTMQDLSVSTGTSLDAIGHAALTLAQAGKSGDQLKESLSALAQVPLLSSFDSIEQATTALIAIQGQFGDKAGSVISIFDRLDAVAKKYAVTSTDLGEAVKRGGGMWASMGGSLDEYLAIVATVKEKTQESADSIGTGMRTISGFLGRDKTMEYLKSKGVQVEDGNKRMLSQYQILKQTAEVYKTLPDNDQRALVEHLGGSRQAGRTTSILENFGTVEEALKVSGTSSGTFSKDTAKGLESMSKQLDILKNQFTVLALKLTPDVFAPFIKFLTQAGTLTASLMGQLGPLISLLSRVGVAALAIGGGSLFNMLGSKLSGWMGGQKTFLTAVPGAGVGGSLLGGGLLEAAGLGSLATKPLSGGSVKAGGMSTLGQVALLGAFAEIVPSLAKMGLEAGGAGTAVQNFTAKLLSSTATMVAVMAMLQGRSIGQTIKNPLGGLVRNDIPELGPGWGKMLSYGGSMALGLGLVATQAYEALQEEIAKKLDEVGEEIKRIKVPNTGKEASESLSKLTTDIDKGMDEALDAASGLAGFLGGLGKRLGNFGGGLLSGDFNRAWGAVKPSTPLVEGQEVIDKLVGQNLPALNGILEQMMRDNGLNFRQGMHKTIRDTLASGNAHPDEYAQAIETSFIKKIGGADGIEATFRRIRDAGAGLGTAAENARTQLSELAPPSLLTNMTRLGEAVSQAVKAIDASIASFDTQRGAIDTLTAPKLPSQIGKEEAGKLLGSGALAGLPGLSPDIQKQAQGYQTMRDLSTNFVASAGALQMKANAERDAGGNPISPLEGEGLKGTLDQFMTQNKGQISDAVRPMLRLILVSLAHSIVEGLNGNTGLPTKADIEKEISTQASPIAPNAQAMSQVAAEQMGAMLRQGNKANEVYASQLDRRVKSPRTPEQAFGVAQEMLQENGLGSYANPSQYNGELIGKLGQARTGNASRLAAVANPLTEYLATGEAPPGTDIIGMFKEFKKLTEQQERLRATQNALEQALQQYSEVIDRSASEEKDLAKAREDLVVSDRNMKEIQWAVEQRRAGASPTEKGNLNQQSEMIRRVQIRNAETQTILSELEKTPLGPESRELRLRYQDSEARRQESLSSLSNYYADRTSRGLDNRPADEAMVGVNGRLAQDIKNSEEHRRAAFDVRTDTNAEAEKRRVQGLLGQSGNINSVVENELAKIAGLDDPFGSKVFLQAVEKFDKTITRLETQQSPAKPGEKFANGYAVSERFTPLETRGLEKALYGDERSSIMQRANTILGSASTNPFKSEHWVDDAGASGMWRGSSGHTVTSIDVGSTKELFDPNNANQLEQRSKTLASVIVQSLQAEGKKTVPGSEERIAMLLQSRGNLGNDQVKITDALKALYELKVKEEQWDAETKLVHESNTAAIKDNTAALRGTTTQPTTQPSVSIAPASPGGSAPSGDPDLDLLRQPFPSIYGGKPPAMKSTDWSDQRNGTGTVIGANGKVMTIDHQGIHDEKGLLRSPSLKAVPRPLPNDQQDRDQSVPRYSPNNRSTNGVAEAMDRMSDRLAVTDKSAPQGNGANGQDAAKGENGPLAESLTKTAEAINKGMGVKVEAVQNLNVNVTGLSEAIEGELKPLLQEVASRAAKEVVRRAMLDLASASDSEGARVYNSAARNLS